MYMSISLNLSLYNIYIYIYIYMYTMVLDPHACESPLSPGAGSTIRTVLTRLGRANWALAVSACRKGLFSFLRWGHGISRGKIEIYLNFLKGAISHKNKTYSQ